MAVHDSPRWPCASAPDGWLSRNVLALVHRLRAALSHRRRLRSIGRARLEWRTAAGQAERRHGGWWRLPCGNAPRRLGARGQLRRCDGNQRRRRSEAAATGGSTPPPPISASMAERIVAVARSSGLPAAKRARRSDIVSRCSNARRSASISSASSSERSSSRPRKRCSRRMRARRSASTATARAWSCWRRLPASAPATSTSATASVMISSAPARGPNSWAGECADGCALVASSPAARVPRRAWPPPGGAPPGVIHHSPIASSANAPTRRTVLFSLSSIASIQPVIVVGSSGGGPRRAPAPERLGQRIWPGESGTTVEPPLPIGVMTCMLETNRE